ncbi:thyrotropin-releasing hormone receptor-like [Tropilaelaps mercedesae]|uniref:Thyrotropin-releasing hormone receptor n=2 Tax=Tropilaelaps mercedesae TaxID=418985 RepID=A0A1V9XKX2_9ACAR|nr:thyrotropin-releasing hormone receptor-like [Tropilaelaps mercedesae]
MWCFGSTSCTTRPGRALLLALLMLSVRSETPLCVHDNITACGVSDLVEVAVLEGGPLNVGMNGVNITSGGHIDRGSISTNSNKSDSHNTAKHGLGGVALVANSARVSSRLSGRDNTSHAGVPLPAVVASDDQNDAQSSGSGASVAFSSRSPTNVTASGGGDQKIRLREPRYRPVVDTVVGTTVLGAILLIGVAGNIMVVAVVAQTRSMRTPTNCYLVSLSVADLMVLLSAVPNEILAQYILEDEWIYGRVGCAMFVFFQYLGINASSLSITAFTVERYIAICLPMKAQTMCTVKRAKKIILVVWLFALCYCCPWLFFLTTTRPIFYRGHEYRRIETCAFSLQRSFYKRFFFADIILFYVIPLILSCVLYGQMARVLFHTDIGAMACKSNGDAKANANNQSRIQQGGDDAPWKQKIEVLQKDAPEDLSSPRNTPCAALSRNEVEGSGQMELNRP